MAFERNPDDPTRPMPGSDERLRSASQFDGDLQPDRPSWQGRPCRGGRIALFAIAIVAILGVVFYGLNNASMTSPEGSRQPRPPPPRHRRAETTARPRPRLAPQRRRQPTTRRPQLLKTVDAPARGATK